MDDVLRVGLVGAGPWAQAVHAPGVADHPGTSLAAVWARRPEAARQIAEPHGAEVVSDPDELLSAVDVVAFAVPPSVQAELATKAALAGKHLVLEKPLASTVEDAERVAEAVATAGVASLVMLTRRFAAETRELLAELHRVGGWTGGTAVWLADALLQERNAGSRWRHEQGALADVGPHVLDLVDAALGEVTRVIAAHRTEDGLWQVLLAHAGGATSTVTMSLSLPIRPGVNELAVYGRHGYRALGGRSASAADCYAALLDDLVAMVHSGTTTHECDVRRGLHLQRVIAAIRAHVGEHG